MLAKYGESAKFLGNKRRFIQLVITEIIKVHKMKKDELEAYLAKEKFDLHNDSYDYIIRIPVYNLTKDKVDELDQEIASLKKTITQLGGKTIESMWGDDLDVFEKKIEVKVEKAVKTVKAKADDVVKPPAKPRAKRVAPGTKK
jgi:DNA gyrase/topoisomerase IV subunit A